LAIFGYQRAIRGSLAIRDPQNFRDLRSARFADLVLRVFAASSRPLARPPPPFKAFG
jgi:hypothetical protein